MSSNYLVTGGHGRLGSELHKYFFAEYPTKNQFDILTAHSSDKTSQFDGVVHMAAYTAVDKAEEERNKCFTLNVIGTMNLLRDFMGKPFVFISTEHVSAEGVYFKSKLLGEELVKVFASNYLIIRTLFKPTPWQYPTAWIDQMTQGDYVDVIAPLIAKEIHEWDGQSKTIYVGTGRKSMYELALRTNPEVKPTLVEDAPGLKRPKDYV